MVDLQQKFSLQCVGSLSLILVFNMTLQKIKRHKISIKSVQILDFALKEQTSLRCGEDMYIL